MADASSQPEETEDAIDDPRLCAARDKTVSVVVDLRLGNPTGQDRIVAADIGTAHATAHIDRRGFAVDEQLLLSANYEVAVRQNLLDRDRELRNELLASTGFASSRVSATELEVRRLID
jgi:hypothetical protein